MTTLKISEIHIGDRVRKDVGDIKPLAQSLQEIGLLHPIVIDGHKSLIAGVRRMAAAKYLGWKEVPVRMVKSLNEAVLALKAERDENTCRKDFLPTEAVAMAATLEELEKPKAESRKRIGQKSGGRGKKKLASKIDESFRTDVEVGKAVGLGKDSYRKAKFVVEAAAKDPDLLEVQEKMDKTGNVDRWFKIAKSKIEKKKRVAEAAKLPPTEDIICGHLLECGKALKDGTVDLILTDPPYLEKTLQAYDDLAEFAACKLRPGGLLLSYAAHYFLPQIIASLGSHLEYWWTFCCHHKGTLARLQKFNLSVGWKPIVAYCKPPFSAWWEPFCDTVGSGREKSGHDWQQAVGESEDLIVSLCPNGGLVVDPFCGSGTVLVAAKKHGRKFWGCDIDPTAVATARTRVYA